MSMMSDSISRQAAIKAFSVYNGKHIPEVDCDNMPVEISIKQVKDTLRSLPSADRPMDEYTEWLEEKLLECEPDILCDVVCNQDEIWCEENCKNMRPECLRKCYEICKGEKP